MQHVRQILPDPADPDSVRVCIGRKRSRILRTDAQRLHLEPGLEVDEELAARIDRAVADRKLATYARNSVAARPCSKARLLQRLTKRGCDKHTATRIVEQLESQGLVDDPAYARLLARSIVLSKPAGKIYVESKLVSRGIPRRDASEAAEEALRDTDLPAQALELARRRARPLLGRLDPQVVQRRVFAHLARRGFDLDTAREAANKAIKDPDATD